MGVATVVEEKALGHRRLVAAVVLLLGLGGLLAYLRYRDAGERLRLDDRNLLALQLAGDPTSAHTLVCGGSAGGGSSRELAGQSCGTQVLHYQQLVEANLWLLVTYLLFMGGTCLLASLLLPSVRLRRLARTVATAAVLASVLHAVEDLLIHRGLDSVADGGPTALWSWVAPLAIVKLALLLPANLFSFLFAATLLVRTMTASDTYQVFRAGEGEEGRRGRGGRPPVLNSIGVPEAELDADRIQPPPAVLDSRGRLWPGGSVAPATQHGLRRPPGEVGICVSGGGIRSATVTFGALHELRQAGVLQRARYLVAVSGGGFAVGAWQMALVRDPQRRTPQRSVDDVFTPDSPELDHVRRHGRYLADSLHEWLLALGSLLRGVVTSLALVAGLVTVAGLVLGVFYHQVPLVTPSNLPLPHRGRSLPDSVPLDPATVRAVLVIAGAGLVLWLVSVFTTVHDRVSAGFALVSRRVFALGGLIAVLGVVVPVVAFGYVQLLWTLTDVDGVGLATVVAGGGLGSVVTSYAAAVVVLLWRQGRRGARRAAQGEAPRRTSRLGTRLVVVVAVAVLVFLYGGLLVTMMLLGANERTFAPLLDAASGEAPWSAVRFWPHVVVVLVPVLLGFVVLFMDQTWMSLHAFYRRRLTTAFAVRRGSTPTGQPYAQPYAWEEPTTLSAYAERVEGMPQVIFAAAANLSGTDRTPPGRRATSFTLSSDWVGGAEVGYVRTSALEHLLQRRQSIQRDLTVQSAMAISGAAFASGMGRETRSFQSLLALSNVRLGTWLPNPGWIAHRALGDDGWRQPRLPRIRRVNYLVRELFGHYPAEDRMLLVTDGGHYENLGLVELLRHRCRTVYCLDATADAGVFPAALADAVALAGEELGVELLLEDTSPLAPGSGSLPGVPTDLAASIAARLAADCVVEGRIVYPEAFRVEGEDAPSAEGRIVVATSRLVAGLPVDVLRHAETNPAFPHDSTSDQWFDHAQFNSYYALGRHLGREAAAR